MHLTGPEVHFVTWMPVNNELEAAVQRVTADINLDNALSAIQIVTLPGHFFRFPVMSFPLAYSQPLRISALDYFVK